MRKIVAFVFIMLAWFSGNALSYGACDPDNPAVPCTYNNTDFDTVMYNDDVKAFYQAASYIVDHSVNMNPDYNDIWKPSGPPCYDGIVWINGNPYSFCGAAVNTTVSGYGWVGAGKIISDMKLPLPGNKNWLLTTEVGGTTCIGGGGTDTFHMGDGYYSLDFDDRSSQNGQEVGVPVYAAAAGIVDNGDYGYDEDGYGFWVKVNHGGGYKTLYGHLTTETMITTGSVGAGAQLGYVGTTGNSTGTHLHFQVFYNGSSASSSMELTHIRLEGLNLADYVTALSGGNCSAYYSSTNTQ